MATKIERSPQLRTESGVGQWLGYERSKFNNWIGGVNHPSSPEDWENLTRLPGVDRDTLRRAELCDKLHALMLDQKESAKEMAITALRIWEADDQRAEIAEILDAVSELANHQDHARR